MHKNDRYRLILTEVARRSVSTPSYLADLLGVSEATVRRDLIDLDEQGKLKRLRGGVEAIEPPKTTPLLNSPLSHALTVNTKAKRLIGQAAAQLVQDNDSIIITPGSTTLLFAEYIANTYFHVLTNSFAIAHYLLENSKSSVHVTNGKIYRHQNLIISQVDMDNGDHFFASKIFLGATAINEMGIMETDPQIARCIASLINKAQEVILLIDSSKFNTNRNILVAKLEKIDHIITNDNLDPKIVGWIEQAGCKLTLVPNP